MNVRVTSGPITGKIMHDVVMSESSVGWYNLMCYLVALMLTVSMGYLYFDIDSNSRVPIILSLLSWAFIMTHIIIGLRSKFTKTTPATSVFVWSPSLVLLAVILNLFVSLNYLTQHST